LVALGPAFVAASRAAFAGEHFTAAASLALLVPKWLPAPIFVAYFVGCAHLAAASSFAAKRLVRWSAISLAVMFALFVLLMDLPGASQHPASRIKWILVARETTFAIGALALYGSAALGPRARASATIAEIARSWTGFVLIFYGAQHLLNPEYSPGVPDSMLTAAWVPVPHAIAYATGILLIGFGIAMFVRKYAAAAAARCGLLMLLLTITLYVPQCFLARTVADQVNAINFVFDTLLFSGMMLVIGGLCGLTWRRPESPMFRQTTGAPE
ncbi:MAG: hypothetical protein M3Z17_05500, partial [Gemmatimonadota bacterium]|nr:hypothetical protein [Gemmatimonadota bacterium]